MQTVTAEWKEAQQRFLLPETFVEISCRIPDVSYEISLVSATDEAAFSATSLVATEGTAAIPHYATLERNLWVLDGTRGILPDLTPNLTPGYVSNDNSAASVTVEFPAVIQSSFPGITVVWSNEFFEYPSSFNVVAKNGGEVVAAITITDNRDIKSLVDIEISGFDSITVEPTDWCLPDRRFRVEKIILGHDITFNKGDLISYQHQHTGDILCGELPKNMIQFSVLNADGRWNPSNPTGLWRYLSDRQKVTARYGLNVNGTIEWIPAGVFYLSDWSAPANGMEATFEARDIFEYLLNVPYTGETTGTMSGMVTAAIGGLISDVTFTPEMSALTGTLDTSRTAAEVIQLCANASCSSVYQNRTGGLVFKKWDTYAVSDYVIGSAMAYANPEITLSKPMKGITVTFNDTEQPFELVLGTNGEIQTATNNLIGTIEQAVLVADWMRIVLESRRSVSGEYRSDPRLDLYDIVTVESKYGAILPVVITDISYSYNGCFKATYKGRVIGLGGE